MFKLIYADQNKYTWLELHFVFKIYHILESMIAFIFFSNSI